MPFSVVVSDSAPFSPPSHRMRHLIPLPLLLLLLALLIFLFHPTSSSAMQRPGGTTTHTRPVTTEVTALCNGVRVQAEERIRALGGETETWEAEGYRSQVVAGTNYFVKVGSLYSEPQASERSRRRALVSDVSSPSTARRFTLPGPDRTKQPETLARFTPHIQRVRQRRARTRRSQADSGRRGRGLLWARRFG